MKKVDAKSLIVGVAAIVGIATASVSPVLAQSNGQTYQANLTELNGSGTTGTATVTTNGRQVTVKVNTTGASANLVHGQHIRIGGQGTCPGPNADTNKSGFVNTVEGKPFYGEVKVSLTTQGSTGTDSALAADRYPKADAKGNVTYTRTFTLPSGVNAQDLANAVVVQHGISKLYDKPDQYDGHPRSTVSKDLPFEATAPAACGTLSSTPAGGVNTGGGATAGIESSATIALGATALVAAGALVVVRKKAIHL